MHIVYVLGLDLRIAKFTANNTLTKLARYIYGEETMKQKDKYIDMYYIVVDMYYIISIYSDSSEKHDTHVLCIHLRIFRIKHMPWVYQLHQVV